MIMPHEVENELRKLRDQVKGLQRDRDCSLAMNVTQQKQIDELNEKLAVYQSNELLQELLKKVKEKPNGQTDTSDRKGPQQGREEPQERPKGHKKAPKDG